MTYFVAMATKAAGEGGPDVLVIEGLREKARFMSDNPHYFPLYQSESIEGLIAQAKADRDRLPTGVYARALAIAFIMDYDPDYEGNLGISGRQTPGSEGWA